MRRGIFVCQDAGMRQAEKDRKGMSSDLVVPRIGGMAGMAVNMFAAICVGSTVTEMKIFEFTSRKMMKEIDCVSTRLNLGTDAYAMKQISSANAEKLCAVLRDFRRIMDGYRITDYRACATSAFREARNRMIMQDYIEKQTGIRIEVLSNSEQRFVDYQAIALVTSEFESIIQNPAAIVDIGGSSMQISLFDKDKLITTQNIRVGSITIRERLAPLEKNGRHFEQMVREILDHELDGFNKLYQKDRQIRNLIVIGGSQFELMKQYAKKNRKITSVSKAEFQKTYEQISGMNPDEIARGFALSPEDSVAVGPSAIFCKALMENFGVDTVWLPGCSMCDGLAYDYGVQKRYIQNGHKFEEDIIAAARSISKRYKCSQAHIRNLEGLALQVFDRMKKVHGMGSRERLLLQIAVILHNCGKFISLENVSECAFNIIMATEIIGLSHAEREMIAYTVKFNTSPYTYYTERTGQSDLSADEYLCVAKLTAILRIVNALDRTHRQKCEEATVTLKEHELRIVVTSREDLSLEIGTFQEKAAFFEEVFNVHPVLKLKKTF